MTVFFQNRRDDARGSWRLAQVVIMSWRNVIRIVTSRHGDHTTACLKELSLTFKLGWSKKSLSLMVKIQVKYQQNWHFHDSLLLFVFFQCQWWSRHIFQRKNKVLSSIESTPYRNQKPELCFDRTEIRPSYSRWIEQNRASNRNSNQPSLLPLGGNNSLVGCY